MRTTLLWTALALGLAGCHGAPEPGASSSSSTASSASGLGGHVDGAEARALVSRGAFLLDVRTPAEFGGGHIEGATNIPVQDLRARIGEVPTDTKIVVYCLSGGRSSAAARMLRESGRETYDLGPMSAW